MEWPKHSIYTIYRGKHGPRHGHVHSHDITRSHRHIHTHTHFHSLGHLHGVTQGNRQVGHTYTQRKQKPVPYTPLTHTGNIYSLSPTQLTFCNRQEFQIRSQIHNSNHTQEAVVHTWCHVARWTVTYATPVTYTDMVRNIQPLSYTLPSHRPSPTGTM